MNLMCEEVDFIEPRQSQVAAFYNDITQNHLNIIHKTSESNGIFHMYLVVFIPIVCYDFIIYCYRLNLDYLIIFYYECCQTRFMR